MKVYSLIYIVLKCPLVLEEKNSFNGKKSVIDQKHYLDLEPKKVPIVLVTIFNEELECKTGLFVVSICEHFINV